MVDPTPSVPFILLSLLLLGLGNGVVCLEEKRVLSLQKVQPKLQSTDTSCFSQKSRREMGATILEMKHRDHCSGVTRDWNEKLQKRLTMDAERVKSLQSRIKRTVPSNTEDVSNAQIPVTSGIELETLNYIVTVELGARKMTVIVDTGSDLTWVQCQPCDSCYNQRDPVFKPSTSPSYQPILCNASACQSLQFATGNSGVCGSAAPICNYAINYGDGSFTRGELGHEKLKFGTILVKDFIFGCGRNNKGLFGGVSGLMGLGRSDLSLISQTSGIFGGVFSYCLPSTERKGSGSLILGGNSSVYRNSSPISYAKMIENPQLYNFYFINLTGISIGGVALQAPSVGPSRILVDSGTVITRLPPTIYKALKAEFLKQFTGFPPAPAFSILDTCFNLSAYQEVDIPTIKMHFEGNAELTVDVTGVFYFVKSDASQVCLALASLEYQDEVAILGNYQQKNLRVIYDTKETKVGFALETCSFE
ncbi:hypothetical protein VitviT2T_014270 [Vitis vinifera]|uniref:Peptidase A1 domain-containing protein n=3 Tax=Vitis vinifera TaxID=29760 RepID=A0ABY9CJ45_VITVI|nr:hypothetical protein VitviT2T_014270 [Vitis vinifera]